MEKVDIVIIGAGVVGLAVAHRLSKSGREIVVLEKHDGFGREASSRNSEVIHAGFYYPEGSLKARLCVEGNRMLYELCQANRIPHRRIEKILVANNDAEEDKLHLLLSQGEKSGVPGLRLLTGQEVGAMESAVTARMGLHSPSSGIIDSHRLMQFFASRSQEQGATIAYGCEARSITRGNGRLVVEVRDTDGSAQSLETGIVVNAAGLGADAMAASAGIDLERSGYRLHPCKGEYFRVASRHNGRLQRLVYPAPTKISLGVHAVIGLDNSLRLGPNAFYVDEIDYNVDPGHQAGFFEEARKYLPFIAYDDLSPDQAGIRAKLQTASEDFRDFVIREESDKGMPGLIDLIGIESPGLTSAPAIAARVEGIIAGRKD